MKLFNRRPKQPKDRESDNNYRTICPPFLNCSSIYKPDEKESKQVAEVFSESLDKAFSANIFKIDINRTLEDSPIASLYSSLSLHASLSCQDKGGASIKLIKQSEYISQAVKEFTISPIIQEATFALQGEVWNYQLRADGFVRCLYDNHNPTLPKNQLYDLYHDQSDSTSVEEMMEETDNIATSLLLEEQTGLNMSKIPITLAEEISRAIRGEGYHVVYVGPRDL